MLVDAHCHIDMCKRPAKEVVAGDVVILTNGVNLETNKKSLSYSQKFSNVYSAMGLYPCIGMGLSDKQIDKITKFIEDNKDKIVAIGEVGLDYYHTTDPKEHKREQVAFKKMIELANKINKPLVIHSRKAIDDSLEMLKKAKVSVIMHCFEGNNIQTEEALKRGYYFTIPANFWTRKSFKKSATRIPITNLLTETDSPYLSPIEGENRPQNVKYSIEKLAEIKKMKPKEVEEQIYQNFTKIFIKE